MAEVCTPPKTRTDKHGEEWATFGPDHTVSDICRWIMGMGCGQDARDTLTQMIDGTYGQVAQ